jgi:hypothetical protein
MPGVREQRKSSVTSADPPGWESGKAEGLPVALSSYVFQLHCQPLPSSALALPSSRIRILDNLTTVGLWPS